MVERYGSRVFLVRLLNFPKAFFLPYLFPEKFRDGHGRQLSSKELMCRKGWKIFTCLGIDSYRDKGGAVLRIDAMFPTGFPNA